MNNSIEYIRSLPVNIRDSDLPLFQHELKRSFPPPHSLDLSNVTMDATSFLIQNGQVIDEATFSPFCNFTFPGWKTRTTISIRHRFRKPFQVIHDPCIWICDKWSYGYFHWITEALPKLESESKRLNSLVLILPDNIRSSFAIESLSAFGLKTIIQIPKNEFIIARQLIYPLLEIPTGNYHDSLISQMRDRVLKKISHPQHDRPQPNRRVYITRRNAATRRIINEPELMQLLSKYNFESIEAENMSFTDQVKLLSETRILLSAHGAGLTNMIWMPPNGCIVELRANNDRLNNCYFSLASVARHGYYYINCQIRSNENSKHDGIDLQADLNQIEVILKDISSK